MGIRETIIHDKHKGDKMWEALEKQHPGTDMVLLDFIYQNRELLDEKMLRETTEESLRDLLIQFRELEQEKNSPFFSGVCGGLAITLYFINQEKEFLHLKG